MKYIDKDKEKSKQGTKKYIRRMYKMIENNEAIIWGIALKENRKKLIGSICLWHFQKEHYRAEIGYVLHPDLWRKGYMKEAIGVVTNFGFKELQLHSIEAMINPANIASASVLKSAGFVQEAYFRENYFFNGVFLDTAVYSILHQTEKK
jgi:ribosomal-protein-alanine N-acetyltransferase